MREILDEAVVLRTYKSGEADRIVIVWTRHFGKLRVLAKGARKTSSRLGASLETLAHVNVDLLKTRGEFYVARHVQHHQRLATLRSSYQRISAGYAVVEVVDAIPSDGVPDEAIFELLVRVLTALDNDAINPELVPASFYLRLLALDGSAPVVTSCVNCERTAPLVAFDAQIGGTLCDQCRRGVALSGEALSLLRRVVGGELGAVLRESSPPGAGEVMAIAHEAIEVHFGRRLRVAHSTPLEAL